MNNDIQQDRKFLSCPLTCTLLSLIPPVHIETSRKVRFGTEAAIFTTAFQLSGSEATLSNFKLGRGSLPRASSTLSEVTASRWEMFSSSRCFSCLNALIPFCNKNISSCFSQNMILSSAKMSFHP